MKPGETEMRGPPVLLFFWRSRRRCPQSDSWRDACEPSRRRAQAGCRLHASHPGRKPFTLSKNGRAAAPRPRSSSRAARACPASSTMHRWPRDRPERAAPKRTGRSSSRCPSIGRRHPAKLKQHMAESHSRRATSSSSREQGGRRQSCTMGRERRPRQERRHLPRVQTAVWTVPGGSSRSTSARHEKKDLLADVKVGLRPFPPRR